MLPLIRTEQLSKQFGMFWAVNRLTLEVGEGETFGLLGPNGAGKTTTVRMLSCIISPSEGSALVAGHDITRDRVEVRRSVGILTENPSLYEKLTPVENLKFFAQAYGITNESKIRARTRELLEFFGLWDRRDDKVAFFSKGMKQKLAIARAIIHDPPVLFLDEPTAGLDPEAAKLIRDMVVELTSRERHTVMLCTHRLEDAEKVCNRVMIINRGASMVVGSPDELRVKMSGNPKLEVKLVEGSDRFADRVSSLAGIRGVEQFNGKLLITADDISKATPLIVKVLVEEGGQVLGVNLLLPSLEDAYLKLIREGGAK
ncbi:MAG: ABC transporter ATP-binding protein [Candidatus Methanomethylicus sp.]|nr:ABC transporter ATP-binding protein [Candidatus Methanomethylicus sp.]